MTEIEREGEGGGRDFTYNTVFTTCEVSLLQAGTGTRPSSTITYTLAGVPPPWILFFFLKKYVNVVKILVRPQRQLCVG